MLYYKGGNRPDPPPPHLPGSRNPDYIQQQKIGN